MTKLHPHFHLTNPKIPSFLLLSSLSTVLFSITLTLGFLGKTQNYMLRLVPSPAKSGCLEHTPTPWSGFKPWLAPVGGGISIGVAQGTCPVKIALEIDYDPSSSGIQELLLKTVVLEEHLGDSVG